MQLRKACCDDGRKAGRIYQGEVREVGIRQVSSVTVIDRDHVQGVRKWPTRPVITLTEALTRLSDLAGFGMIQRFRLQMFWTRLKAGWRATPCTTLETRPSWYEPLLSHGEYWVY